MPGRPPGIAAFPHGRRVPPPTTGPPLAALPHDDRPLAPPTPHARPFRHSPTSTGPHARLAPRRRLAPRPTHRSGRRPHAPFRHQPLGRDRLPSSQSRPSASAAPDPGPPTSCDHPPLQVRRALAGGRASARAEVGDREAATPRQPTEDAPPATPRPGDRASGLAGWRAGGLAGWRARRHRRRVSGQGGPSGRPEPRARGCPARPYLRAGRGRRRPAGRWPGPHHRGRASGPG